MTKFLSILTALILLLVQMPVQAAPTSYTGTAIVTATVLGQKPQVNSVSPATGANSGVTAVEITGRNFGSNISNIYGVSLDDTMASALIAVAPALAANCDLGDTFASCSGTGSYQILEGYSIPASRKPGIYNVLVTTASGTNMISDVKFTVTQGAATGTPTLSNLTPSFISFMEGISETFSMSVTTADSDTDTVNFEITNVPTTQVQILSGASQTVTGASAASGKAVSYSVEGQASSLEGSYSLTLNVDDDNGLFPFDNSLAVNVFIDPSW